MLNNQPLLFYTRIELQLVNKLYFYLDLHYPNF